MKISQHLFIFPQAYIIREYYPRIKTRFTLRVEWKISLQSLLMLVLCSMWSWPSLFFITDMIPATNNICYKWPLLYSVIHFVEPCLIKETNMFKEEIYCTLEQWMKGSPNSQECSLFSSYWACLLENKWKILLSSLLFIYQLFLLIQSSIKYRTTFQRLV